MRSTTPGLSLGVAAACLLPTLLAYNISPSATLFNQLLALSGWGLVLLLARQPPPERAGAGLLLLLVAALALVVGAFFGGPSGQVAKGSLLAQQVFVCGALAVAWLGAARLGTAGLPIGLLLAGLLSSAIAAVQVFVPEWADGVWIARSGTPGRAVGNLRQPNHLATLLVWAAVAAVWLGSARGWRTPRLLGLMAVLMAALVLSASRTGLYFGIPLLMLWGLLDRSLSRPARIALASAPLLAALAWLGLHEWAQTTGAAFGAEARLDAEGAGSPSRVKILANAWALLLQHPWGGVGWGEFNRAWTLTPFPDRPVAFFDHCHNLPLQLLVELGWPLGLAVLGLLCAAFGLALRLAWRASGPEAVQRRAPLMLLLIAGVHSMLEYPLWYAYFLLPTAFAFGLCLAPETARPAPGGSRLPFIVRGVGVLLLVGSALALWEYQKLVAIYAPPVDAQPLSERIARGQRTLLFSDQADYAGATAQGYDQDALDAARRTGHHLIDARLMIAWARSLKAVGEADKARYVVARLREFRSREGDAWLDNCLTEPQAWYCAPPERSYSWKEF